MKRYLDQLTNQMTMYRLTLYSLMILAAIAIALAFIRVLDYNPLSMSISLLVLVASVLIVNYFLSFVLRLKPNFESPLITAFILFFIFSPVPTVKSYETLAIIAAIAMASKYLLAWRGRHVFNPAAAGAVISGLLGLQFASWWVATGPLLLPTLILGGVVLYKTRRLKMAQLYIAVSLVAIITVKMLGRGISPIFLQTLFTSWPLIFFSAFMLSEPLTQPPRKYQRYIFAVGIALIANAQLHIAPEIALVIGNLYAFVCGQRGGIWLKFVGRSQLANGQIEYSFMPKRRLHFKAGQYIEIQLPHAKPDARGARRMFTITSSPHEELLKIAVRHYDPSSTFKKALAMLKEDTMLRATGIYGDFLLPNNREEKLLFIAGGIGITPFHSQMEWLLHQRQSRKGILLYSVRDEADAVYKETLQAVGHGIKTYIITDVLDQKLLSEYASDIAQRTVYISGPPGMVTSLEKIVRRLGAKKIVKDYFSGY
jgi:ferredoxin-NADP reductase